MGDGFGLVSGRNHTGIDFPQPAGTYVGAAGRGVVTFAGWNSGGYGNLMVVRHRLGFETWYAHLSGFAVGTGANVAGGVRIAYVGSTGRSTGPHLHWEVRKDGVPINPLPYLLSATSLKPFAEAPGRRGLECAAEPRVRCSRRSDDPRRAVLEPCGGGTTGGGLRRDARVLAEQRHDRRDVGPVDRAHVAVTRSPSGEGRPTCRCRLVAPRWQPLVDALARRCGAL